MNDSCDMILISSITKYLVSDLVDVQIIQNISVLLIIQLIAMKFQGQGNNQTLNSLKYE